MLALEGFAILAEELADFVLEIRRLKLHSGPDFLIKQMQPELVAKMAKVSWL